MYGMYMAGTNCAWNVDGCCSRTYISVPRSEFLSFRNWAAVLVVLVILGLWTLILRPHPS